MDPWMYVVGGLITIYIVICIVTKGRALRVLGEIIGEILD